MARTRARPFCNSDRTGAHLDRCSVRNIGAVAEGPGRKTGLGAEPCFDFRSSLEHVVVRGWSTIRTNYTATHRRAPNAEPAALLRRLRPVDQAAAELQQHAAARNGNDDGDGEVYDIAGRDAPQWRPRRAATKGGTWRRIASTGHHSRTNLRRLHPLGTRIWTAMGPASTWEGFDLQGRQPLMRK